MNIDPLCEFKNFKKVKSSKVHGEQPYMVRKRSLIFSATSEKILSIKNNKLNSEKYKIIFYIGCINSVPDDLGLDFSSKEDEGGIFKFSPVPKKYYFSQKNHSIQLRGEFFKIDPYTIEYTNCSDRKCCKKRKKNIDVINNEWCFKCFGKVKSKDFRYLLADKLYYCVIPTDAILSIEKICKEVAINTLLTKRRLH